MAEIRCICKTWCPASAHYCGQCARPLEPEDFTELLRLEETAALQRKLIPQNPIGHATDIGLPCGILIGIGINLLFGLHTIGVIALVAIIITWQQARYHRRAQRQFNATYQRLWAMPGTFRSSVQSFP